MKRLYQAAKELKDINGQSQLARALGTSPQTVKNWESRGISKQGLIDAQNILGISATWLQTGNGDTRFQSHIVVGQDEFTPALITDLPHRSGMSEKKYVFTRLVQEQELTGQDSPPNKAGGNDFCLPLSEAVLVAKGIEKHNIICATLSGDTMSPLLPNGTLFAADKGCRDIIDGQIYAFLHGDLFRTKRLSRLPENQIRITGENKKYTDETVSFNEIDIIGRVFWWSVLV